jgi:glycosyltransferase involved in cell wall biosynthesis
MYGILAAGKPIVAVAPEECDVVSLGTEKGFAVCADPDDPGQFVESVRRIASDGGLLRQMRESAAAVAPAYERKKELEKLVAVVEGTGQTAGPR